MPRYLPDEDAWHYPPAPVAHGWRRLAVVGPLLAVLLSAGAVASALHSRSLDAHGTIDQPQTVRMVAQACRIMTASIEQVQVEGPARVRGAQLADQNLELRRMVDRVRTLDPAVRRADRPLDAWLRDWDDLLRARERYARRVSGGFRGTFRAPTSPDGAVLTRRMNRAADGACVVPAVVLDPDAYRDVAA